MQFSRLSFVARNMEGGGSEDPYKVVEDIRATKFGVGMNAVKNPLAEDMHQSIRHLAAELYQKDLHFVMELVQNADDNVYGEGVVPQIEFVLLEADVVGVGVEWTLVVLNNEVGFSRANVESLCSIGRSTKQGKRDSHGYIGEKGVGFKSVFLVTHHPVVISNGYRIQFHDSPTEKVDLGFIVPEWAHRPSNEELSEHLSMKEDELTNTIIVLPIRNDKVQAMVEQLFQLSPQLVLFLKKIEKLSVRQLNQKSIVVKEMAVQRYVTPIPRQCAQMIENDCIYSLVQLSSTEKEAKYHVWKQEFPVDDGHEVDNRRHVCSWMVTLAFPLEEDYTDTDIYCFLPTKLNVGFPFLINADFLLVSSRDSIRFDSAWNKGIMSCIPHAFISAFDFLLNAPSVTAGFCCTIKDAYRYIPHRELHVQEFNFVRESILQKIMSQDCILLERNIGQHLPGAAQISTLALDQASSTSEVSAMNLFGKPLSTRLINPEFRAILQESHKLGIQPPMPITSHKFYVVDSALDYSFKRLQAIGVRLLTDDSFIDFLCDTGWVCSLPEPLYVELLVLVSRIQIKSAQLNQVPLVKYVDDANNIQLMASEEKKHFLVVYSPAKNDVSMLSRWIPEFRKWRHVLCMCNKTLRAMRELNKEQHSQLFRWLSEFSGLQEQSVEMYAKEILRICRQRQDQALAIMASHFLLHAYEEGHFGDDDRWNTLIRSLPLVDSKSGIHSSHFKGPMLLPGSVCQWPKFLVDDAWQRGALFLSEDYLEIPSIIVDEISKDRMIRFLRDSLDAVDIFEVKHPPNVPIIVPSPWKLSADDIWSFLNWLGTLGHAIPHQLRSSLQQAAWVRTMQHGNKPPSLTFLETGKWSSILTPKDAPFVDRGFYGDLSPFCSVLKDLGMVTDVQGGAEAVAGHIVSLAQKGFILVRSDTSNRWYTYLRKQNWIGWLDQPALRVIWVPNAKGATALGCWKCAADCIISDRGGLFHDRLIVLEKYYKDPDVLKFFKENMGVSPSPGTEKYCSLWLTWAENADGTVSRKHVEDAWCIIAKGWKTFSGRPSPELERFLKRCRIPCGEPPGHSLEDVDTITVAPPKEVLYADNLLLAEAFRSSCPMLKFAWCPRTVASATWTDGLVEAYKDLGVQSLSDALVGIGRGEAGSKPTIEEACQRRTIGRGMYRAVLGYLANPKRKVLAATRKRMAMKLKGVEIVFVERVAEVEYTALLDGKQHVATKMELARWEKAERCIYVAAGVVGIKAQIADELAQEVAKGLIGVKRAMPLVDGLREMLFSAASFDFDDDAVRYLLLRNNLSLSLEDEAVLEELAS